MSGPAIGRPSPPSPSTTEVLLALLVIALVILGGAGLKACWAEHVYGDWTCAYSECRRVVP